ncbi:hypothetical protein DMENIID0001_149250 [Sergentomyia squamirostris]
MLLLQEKQHSQNSSTRVNRDCVKSPVDARTSNTTDGFSVRESSFFSQTIFGAQKCVKGVLASEEVWCFTGLSLLDGEKKSNRLLV